MGGSSKGKEPSCATQFGLINRKDSASPALSSPAITLSRSNSSKFSGITFSYRNTSVFINSVNNLSRACSVPCIKIPRQNSTLVLVEVFWFFFSHSKMSINRVQCQKDSSEGDVAHDTKELMVCKGQKIARYVTALGVFTEAA